MHEMSLLRGLLNQVAAVALKNGGGRVRVVRLKLGPLAHIEPDHLREHFVAAAQGTLAEGAQLEIQTTDELHELSLESIDVEPCLRRLDKPCAADAARLREAPHKLP
jgi:hydrogenase nickel incorporation protein HypA/HybF